MHFLDKLNPADRVAFEASGVTYKLYTDLEAAGLDLLPTTDAVERVLSA